MVGCIWHRWFCHAVAWLFSTYFSEQMFPRVFSFISLLTHSLYKQQCAFLQAWFVERMKINTSNSIFLSVRGQVSLVCKWACEPGLLLFFHHEQHVSALHLPRFDQHFSSYGTVFWSVKCFVIQKAVSFNVPSSSCFFFLTTNVNSTVCILGLALKRESAQ